MNKYISILLSNINTKLNKWSSISAGERVKTHCKEAVGDCGPYIHKCYLPSPIRISNNA